MSIDQPEQALTPRTNALTKAPDASYAAQLARPPMTEDERVSAEAMIGRKVRGEDTAVAVRCAWGLPAVQRVGPRLPGGTPFPTTFWLACPMANAAIGTLEASGIMAELTDQVQTDLELAKAYAEADERFVAFRNQLGPEVPSGMSCGGMPDRVKCLHALYGHHLATDDNPIGAWVADQLEPMICPAPCAPVPQHLSEPATAPA